MNQLRTYYQLTKPGIIYGNALTATGGFLFACKFRVDFGLIMATLVGISLVIACGCVLNNYIDRDIDKRMSRTKKRAIVGGVVSGKQAMVFASFLGIAGFLILIFDTNYLTAALGIVGLFDYLVLYGISKRRGAYGTIIGSISGAMPIVAGYTAVTNRLDITALLLFLILVFWQMPHFYAIAMRRIDDYKSANIPVLPIAKGMHRTKIHILAYILAFIISCLALSILGYTGYTFAIVMSLIGGIWLAKGISGFNPKNDNLNSPWATKMFLFSLVVILTLSITLPLGRILP